MPLLVGAMALAMSTAPVRVRAEATSQSSNSAPDLAQRSHLTPQQLNTISAMYSFFRTRGTNAENRATAEFRADQTNPDIRTTLTVASNAPS